MGLPEQQPDRLRVINEILPASLTEFRTHTIDIVLPESGAILQKGFLELKRARAEGRRSFVSISQKERGSVETTNNIDIKVDTVIRELLGIYGIPVLSEDSQKNSPDPRFRNLDSDYLRQIPALWIVDANDGTSRFENDSTKFSTAIALAVYGEVVLSVVHRPMLNQIWWAQEDVGGAYKNGQRIYTSDTATTLDKALAGDAYAWKDRPRNNTIDLLRKLGTHINQGGINNASSVLDIREVAEGTVHAHYSRGLKPWDMAAPAYLVIKAGGMVTTIEGNPWHPFEDSILATNGYIHRPMLEHLNRKRLELSLSVPIPEFPDPRPILQHGRLIFAGAELALKAAQQLFFRKC